MHMRPHKHFFVAQEQGPLPIFPTLAYPQSAPARRRGAAAGSEVPGSCGGHPPSPCELRGAKSAGRSAETAGCVRRILGRTPGTLERGLRALRGRPGGYGARAARGEGLDAGRAGLGCRCRTGRAGEAPMRPMAKAARSRRQALAASALSRSTASRDTVLA